MIQLFWDALALTGVVLLVCLALVIVWATLTVIVFGQKKK